MEWFPVVIKFTGNALPEDTEGPMIVLPTNFAPPDKSPISRVVAFPALVLPQPIRTLLQNFKAAVFALGILTVVKFPSPVLFKKVFL